MQGYKIPLRDLQFVLHELLQTSATMQACGHEEADRETIDQVLAAAGDFAAEVIAPLNAAGDRQGCKLSAPGVVCQARGRGEGRGARHADKPRAHRAV